MDLIKRICSDGLSPAMLARNPQVAKQLGAPSSTATTPPTSITPRDIERLFIQAIHRRHRRQYTGLLWWTFARFLETFRETPRPHSATLHWNSIAMSEWFRLPWNMRVLPPMEESREILYEYLYRRIPADMHPGINLDAGVDGVALKAPLLLVYTTGQQLRLCPLANPRAEHSVDLRPLIRGTDVNGLLSGSVLDKHPELRPNLDQLENSLKPYMAAGHLDLGECKVARGFMLTLYPVLHSCPQVARTVLLTPLHDSINPARILGLVDLTFDTAMRPASAASNPLFHNWAREIALFGQLVRQMESTLLHGRHAALARGAVDQVDCETLIRELATPLGRHELPLPRRYNYTLMDALHSMVVAARNGLAGRALFSRPPAESDPPQAWADWALRIHDATLSILSNEDRSRVFDWLRLFKGASPKTREMLRSLDEEVEEPWKWHKPYTVYLHSEPGCGKETVTQWLHCLHVLKVAAAVAEGTQLAPPGYREDRRRYSLPASASTGRWARYLVSSFSSIQCGELDEDPLTFRRQLFGTMAQRGPYVRAALLGGTVVLDEFNTLRNPRNADLLLRVLDPGEVSLPESDDVIAGRETKLLLRPLVIVCANTDPSGLRGLGFAPAVIDRVTAHPTRVLPLRERKEDLLVILADLLNSGDSREMKVGMDIDGVRLIAEMPWQDNIRGLQNLVKRIFKLNRMRLLEGGRQEIDFEDVIESLSGLLLQAEEGHRPHQQHR